jgi:preprotein translocase subunit SecF
MTRPDAPPGGEIPVGTAADEQQDADAVLAAAAASADEEALADAGLPQDPEATPGGEAATAAAGPAPAGTSGTARRPGTRAGLSSRLYNGEVGLNVVGRSRLLYKISAVVVLLCLASMLFRGFNFGIDFEGGSSFRLPGDSSQVEEVRAAAEGAGAEVASAQVVGGNSLLVRAGQLDNDTESAVVDAMAEAVGIDPGQISPETVSAEWGSDITDQALIALAVFLVAVIAFLALRFQPKMAVGAMVALAHDIIVTAGVYSLIGFEVTPSTVIGFLTILGFSLYDTVVVFDKVDENTRDLEKSARMTWGEAANLAVNQTLMRSINTTVIALLPVAGLLFVGAGLLGVGTLKDLALVLFVGLAAGAYSSIFLATPIVADLKDREPETIALRKRVLARRAAAARQPEAGPLPVASARRSRPARGSAPVAVAERDALPGQVAADVVVESPRSVRPEPGGAAASGATAAPRPGARPQRPDSRRPTGRKRR